MTVVIDRKFCNSVLCDSNDSYYEKFELGVLYCEIMGNDEYFGKRIYIKDLDNIIKICEKYGREFKIDFIDDSNLFDEEDLKYCNKYAFIHCHEREYDKK